jgi:ADP-ribose pyrophosphatase
MDDKSSDLPAEHGGLGPGLDETPPLPPQTGLIASRAIHDGRIVHLSVDRVRFPDGTEGELEMIRHSGAAAVLPILSDPAGEDPQIMLIRQYRYAAGGYMLEVPAGRPDKPGENWEVCARRELEEETGLVAGTMQYLTMIYTTPGFTDERIHLYMATDLTTGSTNLDVDEFLDPVVMPISEALQRVKSGEINDGKTIATLLYAAGFVLR